MKIRLALALAVAASLAACGGKRDGLVTLVGTTPTNASAKDTRRVKMACPGCKSQKITMGEEHHLLKEHEEDGPCDTYIQWIGNTPERDGNYACKYCVGTGKCPACVMMEQDAGACYNCKGEGYLIYKGKTRDCPNCKGSKQCPICKGSTQCDWCKEGTGKIPFEDLGKKPGAPGRAEAISDEPAEEPAEE